MAKSKVDAAVDYLKQRGWEFRPAEKNRWCIPNLLVNMMLRILAQDNFSIYDNKTLRRYAFYIYLAESQGKTFNLWN